MVRNNPHRIQKPKRHGVATPRLSNRTWLTGRYHFRTLPWRESWIPLAAIVVAGFLLACPSHDDRAPQARGNKVVQGPRYTGRTDVAAANDYLRSDAFSRSERRLIQVQGAPGGPADSTCLAKPGRRTRSALLLSRLRPTSPDFANGRGHGANRPFLAADPRGSPELRRAVGAGPGSPPSMTGLSAPLRQSRHLPVSSLRQGFRKFAPGAARWKRATIREEPIFGVADHTSDERSFAHQG